MWQCDYTHSQLREKTLRPHTHTRLQAWCQHSGVTLPIITLRRPPLSLWSFSERNERRWKFQKDKITNWKWQLSPPSLIWNRPAVSVPLTAHFHTHSQSLYRDQVSQFGVFPPNLYVTSATCAFQDSRCILLKYQPLWNFQPTAFARLRDKPPTREALVDPGQVTFKCENVVVQQTDCSVTSHVVSLCITKTDYLSDMLSHPQHNTTLEQEQLRLLLRRRPAQTCR